MEISRRDIYRYLGYGVNEPEDRTKAEVEQCVEEVERVMRPRFFCRTYPLQFYADDTLDLSCFQVKSHDLSKNLRGCEEVLLFAATLGMEVDLIIRKYSWLNMSRAVIVQAVGAVAIEDFCNEENTRLKAEFLRNGYYLRPRFSPGYGDFPLHVQKKLTEALEAEKRVGITLTDRDMMLPSKSVTAVIGISGEQINCVKEGCEACGNQNCLYRRG